MVLNYHGVSVTPSELNTWLSNNTDSIGHQGGFSSGGWVTWDSIAVYGARNLGHAIDFTFAGWSDTTFATLRSLICKYGPQVVRVKDDGSHFVLAYGFTANNSTVLIHDPAGGVSTRLDTSDPARPYHNRFLGIRQLRGPEYTVETQDGTIIATFHSPGEIVLTDPSGTRVGRDAATGALLQEAPGSFAGTDPLGEDEADGSTNPDPDPIKIAGIVGAPAGTYTVTVTGTGAGYYQLLVSLRPQAWQNGTALNASNVPITPGEVHTYRFDYDPVTGSAGTTFAGGFLGGGQNASVNGLLSFAAPAQKVTQVGPSASTFPMRIFYAPGVEANSFTATANTANITSLFHPVPGTSEVVQIPLVAGKNTVKLSIHGTVGSHSGTDQDAIIFNK